MPARGSGMSRRAMAVGAGIRDPRDVSPETRQKISEALHRFHGTEPGDKRKRKYVPHPRVPAAGARQDKSARSAARQQAAPGRKRAPSARGASSLELHVRNRVSAKASAAAGVQVTRRRRLGRMSHLISAHVRRRRVGLVHIHRHGRRNRSLIHIRGKARAHRVWRVKLVGGKR